MPKGGLKFVATNLLLRRGFRGNRDWLRLIIAANTLLLLAIIGLYLLRNQLP